MLSGGEGGEASGVEMGIAEVGQEKKMKNKEKGGRH